MKVMQKRVSATGFVYEVELGPRVRVNTAHRSYVIVGYRYGELAELTTFRVRLVPREIPGVYRTRNLPNFKHARTVPWRIIAFCA